MRLQTTPPIALSPADHWSAGLSDRLRATGTAGACLVLLLLCANLSVSAFGQTLTTLLVFDDLNGANPGPISLIQGRDGNLYGTSSSGGRATQSGTVFKITAAGELTTLYRFCAQPNCSDGANPQAGLILATDGNFYGTTAGGGAFGAGTVFKITPAGLLTTLYSFCSQTNCMDGASPIAPLVEGGDGSLYGTASSGGYSCWWQMGCGTIFRITRQGVFTTLHLFCSLPDCDDGASPYGGVVQASDGYFYGTAYEGATTSYCGPSGCGTLFKISPAGNFVTLHRFNGPDGVLPAAGLIQGWDGNFYGTTSDGADYNWGAVFKLTPQSAFSIVASVGNNLWGPVTQASDGNFYGMTIYGGSGDCSYGCGTIYQVTPAGVATTLYNLILSEGNCPSGGLLQATNGIFYGTPFAGGNSNDENVCGWSESGYGTVFSFDIGLAPFISLLPGSGRPGSKVGILGQGLRGATGVLFNGVSAAFTIPEDTYIIATVPAGATTGTVTVTTLEGTLSSNVQFRLIP